VVTAEPSDAHLNPAGTVHGGFSATLLDSCMGLALQTTLEKGVGQTGRSDKLDPGIQYTIRDGRLIRIDVWQPRDVTVPPDAATSEGIGINSAEADVKRIHGKQLVITLAQL
jgi:hypothetical protein